jgi:hypothetical protein
MNGKVVNTFCTESVGDVMSGCMRLGWFGG